MARCVHYGDIIESTIKGMLGVGSQKKASAVPPGKGLATEDSSKSTKAALDE